MNENPASRSPVIVDAVDQISGQLGRGRNTDDILHEIRGAQ
jgi:hypothetical protein